MQIKITLSGAVFQSPKKSIDRATTKALDQATTFVRQVLRRETPVRTGRMKAGWKVQRDQTNSLRVSNPVPYSVYVDRRLGIAGEASQQASEYLSEKLGDAVVSQLNK